MANEFVYTGVAASSTEESLMQAASISGPLLPRSSQHETIHACALAHELPEIPGWYGYDFKQHEFIRMPFEELV